MGEVREATAKESCMSEEWKSIPDFPGYEISNTGRVFSFKKSKVGSELSLTSDKDGYQRVDLYVDGKRFNQKVHRLVMLAFGPIPEEGRDLVRHKDNNPLNNHITNLQWGTQKENHEDRKGHGTYWYGEKHPRAKTNSAHVLLARLMETLGHTREEIFEDMKIFTGVSKGWVKKVLNRETWKVLNITVSEAKYSPYSPPRKIEENI